MRTWTAIIRVETFRGATEMAAEDSKADLLRDQTQAAVREAAVLLDDTTPQTVRVVLVKRTQARGAERDRSFTVYRDRRGVLRYDGPYAG